MEEIKQLPLFTITVQLRKSQRYGLNEWKCTIDKQQRICTLPTVSWMELGMRSITEIIDKIDMNEIEWFKIELPHCKDLFENSVYYDRDIYTHLFP